MRFISRAFPADFNVALLTLAIVDKKKPTGSPLGRRYFNVFKPKPLAVLANCLNDSTTPKWGGILGELTRRFVNTESRWVS